MTHNLKICIVDNINYEIIENNEIKKAILKELCDKILVRKIFFRDRETEMVTYWDSKQVPITNVHRYFMGDCITTPILSDAALYEFTRILLLEIEKKLKPQFSDILQDWYIDFYIYKNLKLD